jgi:hypothetical protein
MRYEDVAEERMKTKAKITSEFRYWFKKEANLVAKHSRPPKN